MSFSVRVCAAVGSLPNWCKSSKTPPTHRCKLLLPNWCKTSNIPVLGFLPTALSSLLSFFPRWMERPRHHCLGPSTWLQICGPHQKGYVASLRPHVISLQPFLSLSLYKHHPNYSSSPIQAHNASVLPKRRSKDLDYLCNINSSPLLPAFAAATQMATLATLQSSFVASHGPRRSTFRLPRPQRAGLMLVRCQQAEVLFILPPLINN